MSKGPQLENALHERIAGLEKEWAASHGDFMVARQNARLKAMAIREAWIKFAAGMGPAPRSGDLEAEKQLFLAEEEALNMRDDVMRRIVSALTRV